MKKNDFISLLAAKGYTKKDADKIITDVFDTLMEAMADGESVMIHGFGTFGVRDYAEKEIINPKTKEHITVHGHKTPKFTPGRALKSAVREGVVRA